MKAPEKIYLEKIYPDNGVLPNGLNYNQTPNDIEYIRADAFIEKAKKVFCKVCKMPNCRSNDCKWISTFTNYMKG